MIEIDFNKLKNIYKIDLNLEPNQSFDLYIGDYIFQIELRTYTDERTIINIKYNDELIVKDGSSSLLNVNLNYFSTFKNGVFFFAKNNDKLLEKYNFESFGNGVGLYYGDI
ncbi:hypothetical protein [Campylobacter lanienae]|uniref:phage baseplate plug family protein n=1 Tax=Campylobacter lanienae TaxID=75658 RepID=UPI0024317055|nr:hypothetical protein [Campylobacter lanienae]MDD5786034.1 hypothetical protein [Campylobacter lanienae]